MSESETGVRLAPIAVPIEVRGYDIDAWGIVSNIVYVRWLEDLRALLLRQFVDWQRCAREGFGPVLARTDIQYRRPVRLGDALTGHMWVTDAGRSRWRVAAEFVVDDRVVAAAQQEGYWVDLGRVRPAPFPPEMQARLAAARAAAARGEPFR